MHNEPMNELRAKIGAAIRTTTNAGFRAYLQGLLDLLDRGVTEYEDAIADLEAQLIRNPAFRGDMVGWLDDDLK
ncbi:MAG: hypothetical protein K8L97_32780 [Anaerolineae bacterium]|nr:hypothetical protein [Anaerolineae bacterium]